MRRIIETVKAKPVDRTAGLVVSGGVHFESTKKTNQDTWTDGPPITVEPKPDWIDVRGTSRGKITIVGFLSRHTLLGRCCCGNYECRNAVSWRKGLRDGKVDQGCQYCLETDYLRRIDHFRRTGKNKPLAEAPANG